MRASKIREKKPQKTNTKNIDYSNDMGKYIWCHYEQNVMFFLNYNFSNLQKNNNENKDIQKTHELKIPSCCKVLDIDICGLCYTFEKNSSYMLGKNPIHN